MLSLLQPSVSCNFWTKFSTRMLMWHKTGHVIINNLYLINCNTISYPLKSQSQSHDSCSIFYSKSKLRSLLFKFEFLHVYDLWHWTMYLILTSNISDSAHISQSSHAWLQGICPISYPIYDIHITEHLQWWVVCTNPICTLHAHPLLPPCKCIFNIFISNLYKWEPLLHLKSKDMPLQLGVYVICLTYLALFHEITFWTVCFLVYFVTFSVTKTKQCQTEWLNNWKLLGGRGICTSWGILPVLAWRDWIKPWKTSATFSDGLVEICASHLSNPSLEHLHYTTPPVCWIEYEQRNSTGKIIPLGTESPWLK